MHTKQALHDLGVGFDSITSTQKQQLDRDGFFIVENVLPTDELDVP